MYKNKKHLFFDMDGTLTASRQEIETGLVDLLNNLPHTVSVISGAEHSRIIVQIPNLDCDVLPQSGNHALEKNGNELWQDKLPESSKAEIMEHIDLIIKELDHKIPDPNDLIDDRGSQITLSIYGHNASHKEKAALDPNFEYRKALLKRIPFTSQINEVSVTGSTSLDYTEKGRNKGFNIERFIKHKGWNKDECAFFGDALFPGGNDYTVYGVIDTVKVDSHKHTEEILRNHF